METNAAGMIDYSTRSLWFKFFYIHWFYRDYTAEYIYKYVPKLISETDYKEIIALPQQPETTTETATE